MTAPAVIGRSAIVPRAMATARSAHSSRAAIGRNSTVTAANLRSRRGKTVAAKSDPIRRAAIGTKAVRPRVFPIGSSVTRSLTLRATVMVTSARTRRAAKVFAGTATGLAAIARIARAPRAMATGPSGSLAASANSPVALPIAEIAARARISAIGRHTANPSRGRSARAVIVTSAAQGRVSTSRVLTNRVIGIATATLETVVATSARGFRDHAKSASREIGLTVTDHFASGRNSIAETGRSSTVRVVTGTGKSAASANSTPHARGIATATLGSQQRPWTT